MASNTINRIVHKIDRNERVLEKISLNKDSLSEYGYWHIGYLQGKLAVLDAWLEAELAKEASEENSEIKQVLD